MIFIQQPIIPLDASPTTILAIALGQLIGAVIACTLWYFIGRR